MATKEQMSERNRRYREKNKEKKVAANKRYREGNKEKVAEMNRRWYEETKDDRTDVRREQSKRSREKTKDHRAEYAKTYNKAYNEKNKDRMSELSRRWRQDNKHKVAGQGRLRHLKLKQAVPLWYEDELVKQLYKKRDELNARFGLNLVVDHIIPINPQDKSVCGLHCWANLQLLDDSLNASKLDNYQTDW